MTDPVADAINGPAPEQLEIFDISARCKLPLNDYGNGERLKSSLGDQAIHVVGRGWGPWDGMRYNFEAGSARMVALGASLQRLHEEEAAALSTQPVTLAEVNGYMASSGESDRAAAEQKIKAARVKKRRDYAKGCGNLTRIRSALEMATAAFLVSGEDLDSDRTILQVKNGTIHLDQIAEIPDAEDPDERLARWRAAWGPHERFSLPTRVAGRDFQPEAEAPEFEAFIRLIEPDDKNRTYLKRCLGMVLGGRSGERWLMLLGKGGNGKSSLVSIIEAVLGEYSQPCRPDMIILHRNSGGTGPTPEEAVLPGARLYSVPEVDSSRVLDAGKIKGLTGGDRRQANPKNKELFNYTPVGVLLVQANKMPVVNDPSHGFWRRVYPILLNVTLDRIPNDELAEKQARIRAELPGVLNWLLEGYAEFRAIGLDPPLKVLELKRSLKAMADPVGEFLAEATRQGTGLEVRTSELHKAFVLWCEAEGNKPMGSKAFTASMLALDFARFQSHHWYWRGLELGDQSLLDREGAR